MTKDPPTHIQLTACEYWDTAKNWCRKHKYVASVLDCYHCQKMSKMDENVKKQPKIEDWPVCPSCCPTADINGILGRYCYLTKRGVSVKECQGCVYRTQTGLPLVPEGMPITSNIPPKLEPMKGLLDQFLKKK